MTLATSATGGFMAPQRAAASWDTLEDLVRAAVAGITGLPLALVRPRWQSNPLPVPPLATDWCALGMLGWSRTGLPAALHDGSGDGSDVVLDWVRARFVATFYGPAAYDLADRLVAGLTVEQHRCALRSAGLAYGGAGEPQPAPDLVGTTWVRRVDLDLFFDVEQRRVYPVRNLSGARLEIQADDGQTRDVTITED